MDGGQQVITKHRRHYASHGLSECWANYHRVQSYSVPIPPSLSISSQRMINIWRGINEKWAVPSSTCISTSISSSTSCAVTVCYCFLLLMTRICDDTNCLIVFINKFIQTLVQFSPSSLLSMFSTFLSPRAHFYASLYDYIQRILR